MIIALVGPTGSGKTALALDLAERLGAEIVNADSRQVYRGLDIGSSKPAAAERARVPHHVFDVADPDEPFDCARYRVLARSAIDDIQTRGRSVLLVGGTGLYLKVLRYGLFPGPPRDAERRAALASLEKEAPGTLHARLAAVDQASADRLHIHDAARLIRALEVYELTGRTMSDWQREHGFRGEELPMRMIGLRLDRQVLYERINRRCREMVEGGLIEEVRTLWDRGYGPDLTPLASIGYREIGAYLNGDCSLEQAIADMAQATRRLAKRQLTWFRADPTIEWVDAMAVGADTLVASLSVRHTAAR
jgi:tRNA dimethylallyltransferase